MSSRYPASADEGTRMGAISNAAATSLRMALHIGVNLLLDSERVVTVIVPASACPRVSYDTELEVFVPSLRWNLPLHFGGGGAGETPSASMALWIHAPRSSRLNQ